MNSFISLIFLYDAAVFIAQSFLFRRKWANHQARRLTRSPSFHSVCPQGVVVMATARVPSWKCITAGAQQVDPQGFLQDYVLIQVYLWFMLGLFCHMNYSGWTRPGRNEILGKVTCYNLPLVVNRDADCALGAMNQFSYILYYIYSYIRKYFI